MLHKAWNSKGEMPNRFPRSSVKFQVHTVQNITDFDPNWAFPDYRPVAAFKSLRFALFYMFWDISLKLGIYMQWVVLHVKFEFHSNRDTLTYFTAKNRSKSFICIHDLKNYIEASDLVHTLILWVSWSLLIFVMVGQFLALWRTKTLERGCY